MTPEMEDYARLAEALGMTTKHPPDFGPRREWCDPHFSNYFSDDALPAYLAEPAQMSRILRAGLLGFVGWLIEEAGKGWLARVWNLATGEAIECRAATPEEAVRDCAALALRERA
jgi:hypothetical protein